MMFRHPQMEGAIFFALWHCHMPGPAQPLSPPWLLHTADPTIEGKRAHFPKLFPRKKWDRGVLILEDRRQGSPEVVVAAAVPAQGLEERGDGYRGSSADL